MEYQLMGIVFTEDQQTNVSCSSKLSYSRNLNSSPGIVSPMPAWTSKFCCHLKEHTYPESTHLILRRYPYKRGPAIFLTLYMN